MIGVHLVAVLAQPVLAGWYLTGDVDALTVHGVLGSGLAVLGLFTVAVTLLYVLGGRGRLWVAPVGGAGPVNRRRFLALLGGAAALAGCGTLPGQTGEQLASAVPLPEPFRVPLPVPPTARPVAPGRYLITQRVAEQEILPGLRTPILGYDGIFPGPTIESRRGEEIVVRHRNELPVPTVVHLHGGHTAPEHDGWPLDLNLPVGDLSSWTGHHGMVGDTTAGERDHRYPMNQRAATLWYHDHRMDFTGPAV